jgi:hypothetical protein
MPYVESCESTHGNPFRYCGCGWIEEPDTSEDMTIGNAIFQMRDGQKVTRRGWNGPGQFLELQIPDAHSKMTLPYIYITTVKGDRVPWLASQTDILANDWYIV